MKEFLGLRATTHSYLIDDCSEDKKAKSRKKCVIKRKLKFVDYKNCLEAIKLESKRKDEIDVDSLRNNHREFIKNNKVILKTQQIFKKERYNVFTEEINKTDLI